MNKTRLLFIALLCLLPTLANGQQPASQPSGQPAKSDAKLPPPPDKSLKRQIWEGYYDALLNQNYHLKRSVIMEQASESHAKLGLLVAIVGFIVPFILIQIQLTQALKQKTVTGRLGELLGGWKSILFFNLLAGTGIWYGINSSLEGSSEQSRAQAHKELYKDYKTIAAQWRDLHALSLTGQPEVILRPQFERLRDLHSAIASRETPELYDAELHRQVQGELNKYLIEDAKKV